MAYEDPTSAGMLRLLRIQRRWAVQFRRHRLGEWHSPDAAAIAAGQHATGLSAWDRDGPEVSDDLLDWRPLGESR